MKKLLFLCAVVFLTGCVAPPKFITKQEAYPKVYSQKPASILVVPAINNTTAADAIELYSTTVAYPLAESGYYVLSVPYTQKFLAREGITEGAMAVQVPLEKYKQLFGVDAVLFVTLKKWDTNYSVVRGDVTVAAKAELYSTHSEEKLWHYNSTIVFNTSGDSNNGLVNLIVTAVKTATTDYVEVARSVNGQMIYTMPKGKYHLRHGKDHQDVAVLESKVKGKKL
ncbi:GNA1162 family protein [Parashewanella tropica]|uniref:GNA1162 family protein n=1 Tax=Parashewanella tropica TaxID=2547970 RepID=UPI0010594468|nr:GNA1162 family protein [Parashewanella tropica]